MDKIPTTTFTHSPDTEIDRIFVTARSIYNNFYPGNRFVILPYVDVPGDTSRVVMPDLDYSQIKNFWQRVGKLTRDIPANPHVKFFNELKNLYQEKEFPPIDQKLINKKASEWMIHEKEFWMFIKDIFP